MKSFLFQLEADLKWHTDAGLISVEPHNQSNVFFNKYKGFKRIKVESVLTAKIPTYNINVHRLGFQGPVFVVSFTVVTSSMPSSDWWDRPLDFFIVQLNLIFKPGDCGHRMSFGRTSQSCSLSFNDGCGIYCCHHVFGSICSKGRKDSDIKRKKGLFCKNRKVKLFSWSLGDPKIITSVKMYYFFSV